MTRNRPYTLLAAAAVVLAGLGVHASTDDTETSLQEPVQCQIAVTQSRYGNTFEARVVTTEDLTGTYTLRLSKDGPRGSAEILQSGRFVAEADETTTVGQTTLNGDLHDIQAELSLSWDDETLTCAGRAAPVDI